MISTLRLMKILFVWNLLIIMFFGMGLLINSVFFGIQESALYIVWALMTLPLYPIFKKGRKLSIQYSKRWVKNG